jgi:hypothetical protein
MASIDVAWRLGAGLASLAEAMVLVVVFEAALEARRKVLRFESAHGRLLIRFTATAASNQCSVARPPRAPWGFGSAGFAVANAHRLMGQSPVPTAVKRFVVANVEASEQPILL